MVKKIVPVIALLAVLGGVYKFVLAKPATAEPKPHVQGSVYMFQKEFLINLADGRFAKTARGLRRHGPGGDRPRPDHGRPHRRDR